MKTLMKKTPSALRTLATLLSIMKLLIPDLSGTVLLILGVSIIILRLAASGVELAGWVK